MIVNLHTNPLAQFKIFGEKYYKEIPDGRLTRYKAISEIEGNPIKRVIIEQEGGVRVIIDAEVITEFSITTLLKPTGF